MWEYQDVQPKEIEPNSHIAISCLINGTKEKEYDKQINVSSFGSGLDFGHGRRARMGGGCRGWQGRLHFEMPGLPHGADGSGNQNLAKAMSVTLKPLGGAEVQGMADDELKKVITAGKGKMKPVSGISGADADNVVAYIRTFKK